MIIKWVELHENDANTCNKIECIIEVIKWQISHVEESWTIVKAAVLNEFISPSRSSLTTGWGLITKNHNGRYTLLRQ